jgi:hypothetical protein
LGIVGVDTTFFSFSWIKSKNECSGVREGKDSGLLLVNVYPQKSKADLTPLFLFSSPEGTLSGTRLPDEPY